MKTATITLKSMAPYSSSAAYEQEAEKFRGESFADYEKRTWLLRVHADDLGYVRIPAMAWKNGLGNAAQRYPIKKKGAATFTKNFEAGVIVLSDAVLNVKLTESQAKARQFARDGKRPPEGFKVESGGLYGEWLYVPSDGKKGGSKRVWKCFPVVAEWTATVTFTILDDTLSQPVFAETFHQFSRFIGIGRFRPERGGIYGRFAAQLPNGELARAVAETEKAILWEDAAAKIAALSTE